MPSKIRSLKPLSELLKKNGPVAVARILGCDYHNILNWTSGRHKPGRLITIIAKKSGIDLSA
ncbi:MAG: hypothetical protein KGL39_14365 [Patescibacteria group bacterium]|nr:hypothetical protein [Patescibacteria group bacterium]